MWGLRIHVETEFEDNDDGEMGTELMITMGGDVAWPDPLGRKKGLTNE